MLAQLRAALALLLLLTFITGVAYPLAITGIAQTLFPDKANGSLIPGPAGNSVGSVLIGQDFSSGDPRDTARWFWGRLSATGPVPYTALNLDKSTGSSGSNFATTNPALLDAIKGRIEALRAADAAVLFSRPTAQAIPVDLVTSSASGLDPHISPAAAEYQVPRVAKARAMSEDAVHILVRAHTSNRAFGVLGEPVVNVLELNLALEHPSR